MQVNQFVPLLSIKMTLNVLKEHQCYGGVLTYYSHASQSVNGEMAFAVFYPPQMENGVRLPALTYLAGLTCTQETFMMKGGAQQFASEHGIILIAPDTSPRGAGIATEDDSWDFGTGAAFYIDASQKDWDKNYRMEDYVTIELQGIMNESLNVDMAKQGIFGHSMGGYVGLELAKLIDIKLVLIHSNFWNDSEQKKIDRDKVIELVKERKPFFVNTVIPNLFYTENRQKCQNTIHYLINRAIEIPTKEICAATMGLKTRIANHNVVKNQKVTIIQGEFDSIMTLNEMNTQIDNHFPQQNIHLIKDCGHMSIWEKPTELFEIIQQISNKYAFIH